MPRGGVCVGGGGLGIKGWYIIFGAQAKGGLFFSFWLLLSFLSVCVGV